jgi:hypothetical protein
MLSQIRGAEEELQQGPRRRARGDGQNRSESDRACAAPKGQASMKAGAVLDMIYGRAACDLPPELVPVELILQRWAVSIGDGLPREMWDEIPSARMPPLDDDTAIIVDQQYLRSPPRTKLFVKTWYKAPAPRRTLATTWGMTEEAVERCRPIVLNYMRWRFLETHHRPLLALLEIRI